MVASSFGVLKYRMSRTRVQLVQGERSTPVEAATWRVAVRMSAGVPSVSGLPSRAGSHGPPRAKIPDFLTFDLSLSSVRAGGNGRKRRGEYE